MQCLVAIHCLVYNHEPYLRDCLEGFVMQQTNFPFVAIVHDDASTDASAVSTDQSNSHRLRTWLHIWHQWHQWHHS